MKNALALLGTVLATALLAGSAAASASGSGPVAITELAPATFFSIDQDVSKSANVHPRAHLPFERGTDIDFSEGIVYASEQGDKGGVHVIDVRGRDPKPLAFIPCPGFQNDVAVVRPGLIALGSFAGGCGRHTGNGMRLIDVGDPKKPRYLGGVAVPDGSHTLTAFPGEPLIYLSPGGGGENGGEEFVVDVSDPRKPKIVNSFTPDPTGCHDVSFHAKRKLGFCPGQLGTEIWDMSDPVHPTLISKIPVTMEFPHSAVASPDGNLLVVSDESYVAHDCVTQHSAFGALNAFDITDPTLPVFKGSISSPRGTSPLGNLAVGICGAHNFNFVDNSRKVVSSWYSGGTSVVDFSDPTAPEEIAYYRPADSNTWSSYFYRGYVISNDQSRGAEFMTVDGLPQPPPPPAPPKDPSGSNEDPKEPRDPKDKDPEEPKKSKDPPECDVLSADEKAFAKKVNDARERHGVRRLDLDVEISYVAQAHSYAMRRQQKLYHSPEKWLRKRVTRWEILGENVGRGSNIDSLHEAFMASESHRRNVLHPEFRHLGVGIARDEQQIWITVLFEAYEDPGTTMDMPKGC